MHCAAILMHEASTAATNALALLDVVLGQKLSQSAVGSGPPSMLLHASPLGALVGLVVGFAGVGLWYGSRQRSLSHVLIGSGASPKHEALEGYRQQLDSKACRLEQLLHVPIPTDFLGKGLRQECRRRVLAAVNMAWYMLFLVPRLVGVDVNQLRWILGVVLGFAASLHGWNPLGWGCVRSCDDGFGFGARLGIASAHIQTCAAGPGRTPGGRALWSGSDAPGRRVLNAGVASLLASESPAVPLL